MDFVISLQAFLYLAQTNSECRAMFFELNYLSLRELVIHGVFLLLTGLVYRL